MQKNRYWYVFGLNVPADVNAPYFASVAGNRIEEAQPAPARRLRGLELDDLPRVNNDGGYGFKIASATARTMDSAFTSKASAQLFAKEQAEKNPKTMYGIYECVQVFETTTPTIIEKKWNDNGELIPVVSNDN